MHTVSNVQATPTRIVGLVAVVLALVESVVLLLLLDVGLRDVFL